MESLIRKSTETSKKLIEMALNGKLGVFTTGKPLRLSSYHKQGSKVIMATFITERGVEDVVFGKFDCMAELLSLATKRISIKK